MHLLSFGWLEAMGEDGSVDLTSCGILWIVLTSDSFVIGYTCLDLAEAALLSGKTKIVD